MLVNSKIDIDLCKGLWKFLRETTGEVWFQTVSYNPLTYYRKTDIYAMKNVGGHFSLYLISIKSLFITLFDPFIFMKKIAGLKRIS